MSTVKHRTEDGREIYLNCFISSNSRKLIVINSALGVKRQFYERFAQFLHEKGINVITWDPRGVGESAIFHPKDDSARLREWGIYDFDSILGYAHTILGFDWKDITVIGHSAGGHLTGLSQNFKNIESLVLISAGNCYWGLYPISEIPKILVAWLLVVPAVSAFYGYVPKKFGLGHDLPKGIVEEWRAWSMMKNYLFDDSSLDLKGYKNFNGKITAIGFSDDRSFSPQKATLDLLKQFPNAIISTQFFEPKDLGVNSIGHFSFFKQENLWQAVLGKIKSTEIVVFP